MSEEPNVRTRLGTLAEILNEFARLMDEQAEFHSGQRMDLGNSVVRQAAAQAQRRLKRLDLAGERWLREMEKTMLVEIARASHLASSIITEAATEAWPDLERAVERARTVIRQAAVRDPGLFTQVLRGSPVLQVGEEARQQADALTR